MNIVLSDHGRKRMVERGLSERDIAWVLAHPDSCTLSRGVVLKASRALSPRLEIVVFYEAIGNDAKIVTVYKRSK